MKQNFYSETTGALLFSVFTGAREQKTDKFRVHRHPELELGYICSGSGVYLIENDEYRAESDSLFLIRANEQHCIPTVFTPNLTSFNIHITPFYLWSICPDYVEPYKLRMLIGKTAIPRRFSNMSKHVEELIQLCNSTEIDRFSMRLALIRLIKEITDQFPKKSDDVDDNIDLYHFEDVQKLILYIHEHMTEPISSDDIIASSAYSKSHITWLFQSMTGMTPFEYLSLQRVERVINELLTTNKSVLDIAYDCGFQSQATFNRCFKHVTGITPRTYRQLKQGNVRG